jgi:hypothetical protein
MPPREWEKMSIDELFELHQLVQSALRKKLIAKKKQVEGRLRQLNRSAGDGRKDRRS